MKKTILMVLVGVAMLAASTVTAFADNCCNTPDCCKGQACCKSHKK